jgi:beta-lactamase class A
MLAPITRRTFVLGSLGVAASACSGLRFCPSSKPNSPLAELESRVGGRLGVFAIDLGSGKTLAHRADERFAMCSTFKWVLVARLLASSTSLDERVSYGPAELLEYAPSTRAHLSEGSMSILALAEAAVVLSDNTAANLLLARLGGPEGLTAFVRALGDPTTRLDRTEPTLNTNEPGDPRDTTTPRAMVHLMRTLLCGPVLSAPSRERLLGFMQACTTGQERLRAGLPRDWWVGDKTGTGGRGAWNDVAVAVPPGRAPILIAVYLSGGGAPPNERSATHAQVGALVAREFGG